MKIDLNNPTFILGDFNNEIKSLKIDDYELSAVNKAIKTCCRMPGGKSKSYTGVYDNILYNKATLVPLSDDETVILISPFDVIMIW